MTDHLAEVVGLIMALSIASERLVEIIKGLIPWLGVAQADDKSRERRRGAALQTLAVGAGIFTAYLASDYFPKEVQSTASAHPWSIIGLGLLASGGSGLWNSVLAYLINVKDMKKAAAVNEKKVAGIA